MNIIHDPRAFSIEERITSNGVERRVSVEAAGNDRDQAFAQLHARIAANRPAYTPTSGLRLVLIGGDR